MKFNVRLELSAIFIVFLVLKLCHVINWSWWWVAAPVWLPFSLCVGFVGAVYILYFIAKVAKYVTKS